LYGIDAFDYIPHRIYSIWYSLNNLWPEILKKTLEENLLDLEKRPLSWHWNAKQKGNAVKMNNCAMKP
jgi:hypothetical protein